MCYCISDIEGKGREDEKEDEDKEKSNINVTCFLTRAVFLREGFLHVEGVQCSSSRKFGGTADG